MGLIKSCDHGHNASLDTSKIDMVNGLNLSFWLMTECWSRAYAIMICLSSALVLSSVIIVVIVICEHSSWPHAWPNKVHTLHAHAAISCIVAYQKLYHSDLYLLYSSHICMFILMSIVHEVINIATSNLTETCIYGSFTYQQKMRSLRSLFFNS